MIVTFLFAVLITIKYHMYCTYITYLQTLGLLPFSWPRFNPYDSADSEERDKKACL